MNLNYCCCKCGPKPLNIVNLKMYKSINLLIIMIFMNRILKTKHNTNRKKLLDAENTESR